MIVIVAALATLSYLLLLLAAVSTLTCVPTNGRALADKVVDNLVSKPLSAGVKIGSKLCGWGYTETYDYVNDRSIHVFNYIMQGVYIGASQMIPLVTWVNIPSVGSWTSASSWSGPLLLVFSMINLYYWGLLRVTDPGFVHDITSAVAGHMYYKDEPEPRNPCFTCKMMRPPKTKHCSICKKCIFRRDHHCPWVGICIGPFNVLIFAKFLLTCEMLAVMYFLHVVYFLFEMHPSNALVTFKSFILYGLTDHLTLVLALIFDIALFFGIFMIGLHQLFIWGAYQTTATTNYGDLLSISFWNPINLKKNFKKSLGIEPAHVYGQITLSKEELQSLIEYIKDVDLDTYTPEPAPSLKK